MQVTESGVGSLKNTEFECFAVENAGQCRTGKNIDITENADFTLFEFSEITWKQGKITQYQILIAPA